jgi:hypothetical protein
VFPICSQPICFVLAKSASQNLASLAAAIDWPLLSTGRCYRLAAAIDWLL